MVKDYIIVLSLEFRLRIRLADEFAWDKNIKVREVLFGKLHDTPSPSFSSCDTEPHSPSLCALHPLPLFCSTQVAMGALRNLDFSSTQLGMSHVQPSPPSNEPLAVKFRKNSKDFVAILVGLGDNLGHRMHTHALSLIHI